MILRLEKSLRVGCNGDAMLQLSSNSLRPLGKITEPNSVVRRLVDNPNHPIFLRSSEYLIVRRDGESPSGFAGYFFFEQPQGDVPNNSFLVGPELSYLSAGDIVRLRPQEKSLRALYRKSSRHNSIFATEQCNNYCLMCSQPPREIDDSHLAVEILETIPLMSPETTCLGITGGEPTLLGERLVRIVDQLKCYLPRTSVHILSNGRAFKEWSFANAVAEISHPDLMIGIPLYSDISSVHDYVVQAHKAYDDTIRGIINLKSVGVKVEIRVVLHKLTYARLPQLAEFIRRNLTFCDHVAFMGLEMTGFTRHNLEKLWIDPKDYQLELKKAVEMLDRAQIPTSIYNHQLCILDSSIVKFNRKSISDWKNEYMPECAGCTRKTECGGFFSSAHLRYSRHIQPFSN